MRSSLAAIALILLLSPAAAAAPGDPRVIEGTLEWPATLGFQPFAVIRGDDARHYYADVSGVLRATVSPVRAGERLALSGVEGTRPHELAVVEIGAPGTLRPGAPPAAPSTSSAGSLSASIPMTAAAPSPSAETPAGPPAPDMWRLHGTVVSKGSREVTLRTQDGAQHVIDVSALTAGTLGALRPGDIITLYGEPQADRRQLVATGFIHMDAGSAPAAPSSR